MAAWQDLLSASRRGHNCKARAPIFFELLHSKDPDLLFLWAIRYAAPRLFSQNRSDPSESKSPPNDPLCLRNSAACLTSEGNKADRWFCRHTIPGLLNHIQIPHPPAESLCILYCPNRGPY